MTSYATVSRLQERADSAIGPTDLTLAQEPFGINRASTR